jgi:hypothetical protein
MTHRLQLAYSTMESTSKLIEASDPGSLNLTAIGQGLYATVFIDGAPHDVRLEITSISRNMT